MKKLFLMAVAIIIVISVWGQSKYPDGYFTDETRPNALRWLPAPPKLTGADFTYDFYYYQWGREMREYQTVSEQALYDESASLDDVYEGILGVKLTEETTPEIMLLLQRAISDAHAANKKVKDEYKRVRPFAQFKEESLKPEEDEEEAGTYSYPSGHSSRGWMSAFVFATIAPELAEDLFCRAREYALNRVICGHHWKTDVDASLMLSAGLFSTIVCTNAYQAQLVKARAEYKAIKEGLAGVRAVTNANNTTSSTMYTVNGTKATESSRGIIIQNGKKTVRK